ncbi:MAG: NAD(P)-dependent glycerol-3-phosphate dehydrogenase [Spirochaetaceae bacterium]|jgi:glycerol-3-phosphate dehydrogenase (NAD(P)+)|nr:NAD(P)-dependent glycerol-3-phosphate dehydrogenase [Spirochaetaceae bacterium]
MIQKTIGVIGAGAWGTAMAFALAREGHSVELWALETEVADEINRLHTNEKYLSGFQFPPNLTASADIRKAAEGKDFIILASPSLFLASTVKQLLDVPSVAAGTACIGVLTKGFIPSPAGPRLILETLEEVLPASYRKNLVYISGPSHAEEVAMGKVTGLIAASENPKNSISFRELLKSRRMRVFSSFDVVGVQVCAAAKNVVAIAFGCLDALAESSPSFGDNTESLLLAAGLNEMQTIGVAMGATHAETFTSIAGVGDLDVTCRSKYGRNRRFGHDIIKKNILGAYKSIDDLISHIQEIGYLPEGAVACKYVHEITLRHNLKLPICSGLYRILNREIEPLTFINELLSE